MGKFFLSFWPFFVFLALFFFIFYKVFLFGLFPFPGDLLVSWFFPYKDGGWFGYSPWITHKEFIAADVVRQLFPWRELAIDILKSGQIPLWNPYAFSGTPLLANIQTAIFYPINVLFFFFDAKIAWVIYILFQPLLAFIFMYLFLRSLSLSKYASLFSAVSFGFIGYITAWLEWGVVGHSAVWLPLALWGITNYFKNLDKRYLLTVSLALGCSIFAGHIQTTTYVFIMSYTYYLLLGFNSKILGEQRLRKIILSSWCFFLAFGLTAIQLFPGLQLFLLSSRNVVDAIGVFHNLQLPFSHIVTIIAPDFFGNPATGNFWSRDYTEFMAYTGIIVFCFAFIGIIHTYKDTTVRFFTLFSLLAILLALPTPFSDLLITLKIPVLNSGAPTRILFLFQFSLVVLAAFGIDAWIKEKKFKLISLLPILLSYGLLILFVQSITLFFKQGDLLANLSVIKRNVFLPTGIAFVTLLLILAANKLHRFKLLIFFCILFIAAIEYQYFLYKYSPFAPLSYMYPHHLVVTHLRETTPPYRVFGYENSRIDTNLPTQWRILSPEGYDPLYIQRYGELMFAGADGYFKPAFMRADAAFPDSQSVNDIQQKQTLLNLLGVRYAMYRLDKPSRELQPITSRFSEDRFKLIWQSYSWQVYENKKSLPRALTFYNYTVEKQDEKILSKLLLKDFPYQDEVILEEKLSAVKNTPDLPASPAKITTYSPNKVIVKAKAEADGLLFLSDNFYPGWEAFVDGKPTKIYRADYTFRAVPIKKGAHEIRFEYKPKIFIAGAVISALSLFTIVSMFTILGIRNRRHNPTKKVLQRK